MRHTEKEPRGWCQRAVAPVLVREGLLVRRVLTLRDRAAIAKRVKRPEFFWG